MKGTRILGAVFAGILASSLGTLTACGGSPDEAKETTAQAVRAASVSLELFDADGTRLGDGSGVLIAPRLVLTSGHLIAGAHRWVVKSADGKVVTGSRGMTYDWRAYTSDNAHPRKHDVGVIHLDAPIKLAAYPKLVSDKTGDGAPATRIRGTAGGFESIEAALAKVRSSPNAWLSDGRPGEELDTGGAVFDARGILGVVSGRGRTTGKLYIARVDGLTRWLAPKVACAGGATVVRTYAGPAQDKSKDACEDGGAAGGGTGGDDGNAAGDGSNPNGNGPGDDDGGSCEGNDDGLCSGGACGSKAGSDGSAGPGSEGNAGGGAGGDNGSSGSDGANAGGGSDGSNGSGAGGNDGSSGSDGANAGSEGSGGSGNSGGAGGNDGSSGSDGAKAGGDNGGGAGGSDGEACQGESDDADVCPPEGSDDDLSTAGGGDPDYTMDYGGGSSKKSTKSDDIYLR